MVRVGRVCCVWSDGTFCFYQFHRVAFFSPFFPVAAVVVVLVSVGGDALGDVRKTLCLYSGVLLFQVRSLCIRWTSCTFLLLLN